MSIRPSEWQRRSELSGVKTPTDRAPFPVPTYITCAGMRQGVPENGREQWELTRYSERDPPPNPKKARRAGHHSGLNLLTAWWSWGFFPPKIAKISKEKDRKQACFSPEAPLGIAAGSRCGDSHFQDNCF